MRQWSIRTRITLAVAIAALATSVVAATVGLGVVERRLIDWRLDDYATFATASRPSSPPNNPDLVAALVGGTASSASIIDRHPEAALAQQLNASLGRSAGDPLFVALTDGGYVRVDGTGSRIVPATQVTAPAVLDWDLDEIASLIDWVDAGRAVHYSLQARGGSDGVQLVVGYETSDLVESMASARRALRWVVPLFVVLLALLTWCVTSAALRPVTRITRRVGEISDQGPTTGERVEVPRTRDELAALAARMNDLLDRIGRSARAQRAFTADAGHELRSPLAVLRSEHEQALAAASGASAETLARHSMPEIERLERIVEDLLELARIDEHAARRAAVPVDVDDVVLAEAMRRRSVPVDVRRVSAGQVLADPESLRRIVQHLLDNATRHAVSMVAIGVAHTGDRAEVLLTVDDDGPGIPPDQRSAVFERFVRLDDARQRRSGGSGLGLSVVSELVAEIGGRVAVSDSALGGARFEIRLPAAELSPEGHTPRASP